MQTRRGTGYYKVPSLLGVWYRAPLGHSGWVSTLEEWFNPKRLNYNYVPTGFNPRKAGAAKGHEFGLSLSAEDKSALIAFLQAAVEKFNEEQEHAAASFRICGRADGVRTTAPSAEPNLYTTAGNYRRYHGRSRRMQRWLLK